MMTTGNNSPTVSGPDHSKTHELEHRIVPSDEIGQPVRTDVPCHVCKKTFKQPTALRFHLEKVHKISENTREERSTRKKILYHCPAEYCVYHKNRHFPNRQYLRQHYLKVHAEKKFECTSCVKSFGIENDLRAHQLECGRVYACVGCDSQMTSWRAYKTHCLKTRHPLLEELQPHNLRSNRTRAEKPTQVPSESVAKEKTCADPNPVLPRAILPNPNLTIMTLNVVHTPSDNQPPVLVPKQVICVADSRPAAIAPVLCVERKKDSSKQKDSSNNPDNVCISCKCPKKKETRTRSVLASSSQHSKLTTSTQTTNAEQKRIGAQTQTTGDFILTGAMQSADIQIEKESRASQVSPRAKLKRCYQTTDVQTEPAVTSVPPLKKRRRKKVDTSTTTAASALSQGFTLNIPEWSDTQTQTIALLDELQASLGESISTQTLESYLLDTSSQDSSLGPGLDHDSSSQDTAIQVGHFLADDLHSTVNNNALQPLNIGLQNSQEVEFNTDMAHTSPVGHNSAVNVPSSSQTVLHHDFNVSFSQQSTTATYSRPLACGSEASKRSMACSPIFSTSVGTTESGTDPLPFSDSDFLHNSSFCIMGTQTSGADSHAGTQTSLLDLPDLLSSAVQTGHQDNTLYSNIETQTSEENVLDQLLSNMQTQTTGDFLADFSFSDIETQTLGDTRQTIQTQTSLYTLGPPGGSSTDMQTQTLFNNMEPGIVAPDLSESFTQTYQEWESIMDRLTQ